MTADLESYKPGLLLVSAAGPPLGSYKDALELIQSAWAQGATVIVVPVERLDSSFFQLGSGAAGAFIQKIVDYRLRLAIIGDISQHASQSKSVRDLVKECNRTRTVLFLPDMDTLAATLSELG